MKIKSENEKGKKESARKIKRKPIPSSDTQHT
jgi:hypothetical protein